jgi:hypothetical protein
MAHPTPETSFRFFELAFLWMTIAASAVLTCVLAGLPRYWLEK